MQIYVLTCLCCGRQIVMSEDVGTILILMRDMYGEPEEVWRYHSALDENGSRIEAQYYNRKVILELFNRAPTGAIEYEFPDHGYALTQANLLAFVFAPEPRQVVNVPPPNMN